MGKSHDFQVSKKPRATRGKQINCVNEETYDTQKRYVKTIAANVTFFTERSDGTVHRKNTRKTPSVCKSNSSRKGRDKKPGGKVTHELRSHIGNSTDDLLL